ncbi:hypothetical protein CesoFtcFv8_027321 [Champsocephalus esox]|uniref:Uncharacterized protein n=1 Tax=Champsocephalus esox TaxID=159716 RepID=A0AAN7YBI0_9TELE|nr:hypothetical protein CesoFtcFv8_027321 [Champsocephalus esox]
MRQQPRAVMWSVGRQRVLLWYHVIRSLTSSELSCISRTSAARSGAAGRLQTPRKATRRFRPGARTDRKGARTTSRAAAQCQTARPTATAASSMGHCARGESVCCRGDAVKERCLGGRRWWRPP